MCLDSLVYIPVEEKALVIVCTDKIDNKKLLLRYHKIVCPHVEFSWRKFRTHRRMPKIQFDKMIDKLKLEHDWEQFPFCYLRIVKFASSGKPFVHAQWKSLDGREGLTIS